MAAKNARLLRNLEGNLKGGCDGACDRLVEAVGSKADSANAESESDGQRDNSVFPGLGHGTSP
jgi:hypothetical protein